MRTHILGFVIHFIRAEVFSRFIIVQQLLTGEGHAHEYSKAADNDPNTPTNQRGGQWKNDKGGDNSCSVNEDDER